MIILNYLLSKLYYEQKYYIQTFHIEEYNITLCYINFYNDNIHIKIILLNKII